MPVGDSDAQVLATLGCTAGSSKACAILELLYDAHDRVAEAVNSSP